MPLPQLLGQLQPVHAVHADVRKHQLDAMLLDQLQRLFPVIRLAYDFHAEHRPVDRISQPLADDRFVVHDQHFHAFACAGRN